MLLIRPVSYTHLDVYKRQPLRRIIECEALVFCMSVCESLGVILLPVSYTHLDVYKRQIDMPGSCYAIARKCLAAENDCADISTCLLYTSYP